MALELTSRHLRRLCLINSFQAPTDGMVFFGLRGCVPVAPTDHEFRESHEIEIKATDYTRPRCIIGQWLPHEARLALFPASTIPHIRFIRNVLPERVNQLMPGYFDDYRRAVHQPLNRDHHHRAFKMNGGRPVQRTYDDVDYDAADPIIAQHNLDNIHCAECDDISAERYNSAGCQVIVGRAKYIHRPDTVERGPWKTFRNRAYEHERVNFHYFLLNGRDAEKVILNETTPLPARLRFGSKGALVTTLQRALERKGYYSQRIDDEFGRWTLDGVLMFQREEMSAEEADGVVGEDSAGKLGITDWPRM